MTALANELENRLAEAVTRVANDRDVGESQRRSSNRSDEDCLGNQRTRETAESLLMKERTESAVTYSALELQLVHYNGVGQREANVGFVQRTRFEERKIEHLPV